MTASDLVERLAAHRTVGAAPREQLEWLAAHGTLRRVEVGEVISMPGQELQALYVVLSGRFSIRVDRGSGPRKVMEWREGDAGGILPYSRMATPPGWSVVEEAMEVLEVDRAHFPEMIARCHELTAAFVHVMLDRARRFNSSDLHDEKMVSLGRLSAGLAHELNNPASALARSAKELAGRVFEVEAAALALGAVRLTPGQLAAIARVRGNCEAKSAASLSPIERIDREEALAAWLARHHVSGELVEMLSDAQLGLESLDELAAVLDEDALGFALRSIGACHRTRLLATEVEAAASRIHSLVAAIKGFTYMDQSSVAQPVAVGKGITDTLAVLGGKARAKSVTLNARIAPDLPPVDGFGGELNQVWANLIDNAIDAAPASGHVDVTATREGTSVVVRVVDDGPGMPAEVVERVFEPFFTTKPQGHGTGLGLDIARRLVRQHDGQIELESRPGRTEFRVTLPSV